MKINSINNYQVNRKYNNSQSFKGVRVKFDDRLFARLYELNMPPAGLARKLEFGRYTNGKLEKIKATVRQAEVNVNNIIKNEILPNILRYDYQNKLKESDIWKNGEDSIVTLRLERASVNDSFLDKIRRLFTSQSGNDLDTGTIAELVEIVREETAKKIAANKSGDLPQYESAEAYDSYLDKERATSPVYERMHYESSLYQELEDYQEACAREGEMLDPLVIDEIHRKYAKKMEHLPQFTDMISAISNYERELSKIEKGYNGGDGFKNIKTSRDFEQIPVPGWSRDRFRRIPNSIGMSLTGIGSPFANDEYQLIDGLDEIYYQMRDEFYNR